jgi:hypothetical protein
MGREKGPQGMNRREFLKAGLVGTTTAIVAGSPLAGAMLSSAEAAPFEFPKPVYRTLGRTGL